MKRASKAASWTRGVGLPLALALCPALAAAAVGDVSTLIGRGRDYGDGGPALSAALNHPFTITVSSDGSIYVGDTYNWQLRKIDPAGDISTFHSFYYAEEKMLYAGGYVYAYDLLSGQSRVPENGGAKEAVGVRPDILTATDGNDIYQITGGNLVRYTDPVAGAKATLTALPSYTWKFLAHHGGALYCFSSTATVRYEPASTSSSTLPGLPFGDWPYMRGAAFDGTYLYLVESYSFPSAPADPADNVQHLRRVRLSDGATSVLAGGTQGDRDGTGAAASLSFPRDVVLSGGTLYVADMFNHKIKTVDPATGQAVTIAGAGEAFLGLDKSLAMLNNPLNVTVGPAGTIYIPDMGTQRILKVDAAGVVSVLAGSGLAGDTDGTGTEARFHYPCHAAVDGEFLYVADFGTHRIRRVHRRTGEVTTLTGTGIGGFADGDLSVAQFKFPWGIVAFDGRIYVADTGNHAIREIDLALRRVRTLAGTPGAPGSADGVGAAAGFNYPRGLTVDGDDVYIADSINHTIRHLDLRTLEVTTVAGVAGSQGYANNVDPNSVRFRQPWGVAWDPDAVYVADTANIRIRKIDRVTGATSLLAGNGGWGDVDGPGTTAQLGYPQGLYSQHELGRVLVADTFNHKVKSVEILVSSRPVPPEPPSDLAATALPGLEIKLEWEKSPSPGVIEYRVYMASTHTAFDFYTPLSTVPAGTREYTAENLADETLYRFVVRAADASMEEKNTVEVYALAYDSLVCPAALITSPKSGRKISGQRVTLVTGFPDGADASPVSAVRFQYRSLLAEAFTDVPAANANHPNPDTSSPFFVHWDVSGLANGEYYVRVLSSCGGVFASSGPFISLNVEHSNPDLQEAQQGEDQVRTERVAGHKANRIVVADPTTDQTVQVYLPAGAVSASTDTISVKLERKGASPSGYVEPAVLSRVELTLGSGQTTLGQPAILTFTYDPAVLAGVRASPERLSVALWDGLSSRWSILPSSLDTSARTVTVQTTHFSTFGLLASPLAAVGIALGDVYFFPNPAVRKNPTLHVETNADEVLVRVYNKAGRRVYEATLSGPPGLFDDGNGLEPAYESVWDVSGVAPDVYFFYIEARQTGLGKMTKTGKMAVVK
ncbi:MAG: hypothetical protein ABII00_04345 [Elusimicrobiota bacterium]